MLFVFCFAKQKVNQIMGIAKSINNLFTRPLHKGNNTSGYCNLTGIVSGVNHTSD